MKLKAVLNKVAKIIGIGIILYVVFCITYFAIIGFKYQMSETVKGPHKYGKDVGGIEVSIYKLIANPNEYDGKRVNLIGIANIHPEGPDAGSDIYISKDDYKYHIPYNGLWMELDYDILESTPSELKKFNGKYIRVQGTFNMNKQGAWGMYSGSLEDVTLVILYENESTEY